MGSTPRTADIERATSETDIRLSLNLDGAGTAEIETGIGFFDHMLTLFARHGLFDLSIHCRGDLHVDAHHTVEDVGICLGGAIRQAVGDKAGIVRYGTFTVPMDESLVMVSLDLSGRPYLVCNLRPPAARVGEFDAELAPEFFQAVAANAAMNLHVQQFHGSNSHHLLEAAFKAFGRALDAATRRDDRVQGVPSTKGVL
jgi:imidazoleglycerol-phosphate dehydratase